jgi:hypothetical protein
VTIVAIVLCLKEHRCILSKSQKTWDGNLEARLQDSKEQLGCVIFVA